MKRVLLADDEHAVLDLFRFVLEAEGYAVETVTNGREALARAETEAVDCIVLDVMMPGMDGLEVCRRIRHDGAGRRDVPIVIISAIADYLRPDGCFNALLRKPVNMDEFLDVIARLTGGEGAAPAPC